MKTEIVNFRASTEEVSRWRDALQKDGRSLSKVCRTALDRVSARVEKKGSDNE